jgi:dihydrofolate reductase
MANVMVDLAMSLDGFIAGSNDGPDQPLGDGGMRLFDWYFDGDTPVRHYQEAARRGVSVPPFKLSRSSAQMFEELIESTGAVLTGRRTYDVADAWGGNGPLPGVPLFVLTHTTPSVVPKGEVPYTLVTDGRRQRGRTCEGGGRGQVREPDGCEHGDGGHRTGNRPGR